MSTSLRNFSNPAAAKKASTLIPLVLIAEDDADTRCLFRTLLEMGGYSVIEAANGEETIHLAERNHPDLILMDGGLPLVDGFDATRRIRGLPQLDHVPIVFVSGHAEARFLAMAREAGCDEYLVKPLDFDRLGNVLQKYLGAKAKALEV
jgi:CheY-like chemotaxis protein